MKALRLTAVLLVLASAGWSQTTRQAMHLNLAQLRKLADKGDTAAQCEIGRRHLIGKGMKQSEAEAAVWFGKAAAGGSGDALYELFLMSRDGVGMTKDAAKAEKLLNEAIEQDSSKARIELASRTIQNSADVAASDAAVAELTTLARSGDAFAQLSLGKAIANGASRPAGAGAIQWLLKATTADDERIALQSARVIRDGEGSLRADTARAITLIRRLAEKEVRAAHVDLVKLSPDSYRGVCKEQSIERVIRDDRLIGAPVQLQGMLVSAEKGRWTIGSEKQGIVRVKPELETSIDVTPGRFVRVWGWVDEPGVVQALLAEVPDPKVEVSFRLTEPRIMKGTWKEKFVVNGELRNTGRQHVNSVQVLVRVFQPDSGKEDTETLTITDLPAGQRRVFTAAFTIESVKAADNQTGVVQAEVTTGPIEW